MGSIKTIVYKDFVANKKKTIANFLGAIFFVTLMVSYAILYVSLHEGIESIVIEGINNRFESFMVLNISFSILLFFSVITIFKSCKNSFEISSFTILSIYKNQKDDELEQVTNIDINIRWFVYLQASLYLLEAIPIGIIIGWVISDKIFLFFKNHIYVLNDINSEIVYSYQVIIVAVLIVVVIVYFSASIVFIKLAGISSLEDLVKKENMKINKKLYKKPIIYIPNVVTSHFGKCGEISCVNIKKNKKAYNKIKRAIIISIIVYLITVMLSNFAFITIEKSCDVDYDIRASFYENELENANYLAKMNDVERFSFVRKCEYKLNNFKYSKEYEDNNSLKMHSDMYSKSEDENVNIVCLDDGEYKRYIQSLGLEYDYIKDKAILLDYEYKSYFDFFKLINKSYRKYDYKKNDIIEELEYNDISISRGNDDVSKTIKSLEIGQVTDKKPYGIESSKKGEAYIILSEDLFNKIIVKSVYISSYGYYKVTDPDKFEKDVKGAYITSKIKPYLHNYVKEANLASDINKVIISIVYMLLILKIIRVIVSIFTVSIKSVYVRKDEFKTILEVGMTEKDLCKIIVLDPVFMGIKTVVIGIILCTIVLNMIIQAIVNPILVTEFMTTDKLKFTNILTYKDNLIIFIILAFPIAVWILYTHYLAEKQKSVR